MRSSVRALALVACCSLLAPVAHAFGAPPDWVKALLAVPTPAHDPEDVAVRLHDETVLTVFNDGRMHRVRRVAHRILRQSGDTYGFVFEYEDSGTRVTDMHAWSLPPDGKSLEVRMKDSVQASPPGIDGGVLITDMHVRGVQVPAAVPGNIIAYEIETDEKPLVMLEKWDFQHTVPTVLSRFTLQLPENWSYRSLWRNHGELPPTSTGPRQWTWEIRNQQPVAIESRMPPWPGVAASMTIALLGPEPGLRGFLTWQDAGIWYRELAQPQRQLTDAIRDKARQLVAGHSTPLARMRALAAFVQRDIRYVAIELGIGGFLPHKAGDVFVQRFGDCKDKATLLAAMLELIGVESYYVLVDTDRGAVDSKTPPNVAFNHVILAVRLPADAQDAAFVSTQANKTIGRILYFDPTDEKTPLGSLRGDLQGGFGLLAGPGGGELLQLPQLAPASNSRLRKGKLTLSEQGTLSGTVVETLTGDHASGMRYELASITKDSDRPRLAERQLGASLASFKLVNTQFADAAISDKPFEYQYAFESESYAKLAGGLLLVRPRALGIMSRGFLEKDKARQHPVEFYGPTHEVDVYEITVPEGYVVDELPPTVDSDIGFAAYHSKTEMTGRLLRYTRSWEVRQLSVPAAQADKLKQLYREIADDERNTAVLKKAGT